MIILVQLKDISKFIYKTMTETKTIDPYTEVVTKRIADAFTPILRDEQIAEYPLVSLPPKSQVPTDGGRIAENNIISWETSFDNNSWIDLKDIQIRLRLQFWNYTTGAVFGPTAAVNVARIFNLFHNNELYINNELVMRTSDAEAHFEDIQSMLFNNREHLLEGNNHHISYDQAIDDAGAYDCRCGELPLLVTSVEPLVAGNVTLTGPTVAVGGVVLTPTTNTVATPPWTSDLLTPVSGAYPNIESLANIKAHRRQRVIFNNASCIKEFNIPISFWFDCCKYFKIPIKIQSLKINLHANDPKKYLISVAANLPGIKLMQARMIMKSIRYNELSPEARAYELCVQKYKEIRIPWFRCRPLTLTPFTGTYVQPASRELKSGAYLFNFFRDTAATAIDEFNYLNPSSGNTILKVIRYRDRVMGHQEHYAAADYFSPATGTVSGMYHEYEECARYLASKNPQRGLLVRENEMFLRPVFMTKLNWAKDGFSDSSDKASLLEHYDFGGAVAANREMVSLEVVESQLIINLETQAVRVETN